MEARGRRAEGRLAFCGGAAGRMSSGACLVTRA